ncbi:TRAP transporter small permease [Shumkonia mesophila]|uniref:TRAP transporter small permease n=1 Tax=Shumkonia mesophila TaxID=2838854 RepID=UPI002934B99C|nr:TRAP transporter small permease [Shumkonia mesophila]
MHALVQRFVTWWALAAGVVLLLIVLVTTINVTAFSMDKIARLFDGGVSGLPGYEDFVDLAAGVAGLMLMPYCQLRRGHVAVDLFTAMAPRAVQKALDLVSLIAVAALTLFLAYWMAVGLAETRADGVLSPVLGWPVWPFYLPGVVSLLLWAAVAGMQAFARDADG